MQAVEAVVGTAEVQSRSRRFASLRGAQRALGDALHPQELQRTVEQGRDVLAQLQELSQRVRGFENGEAPASPEEREAASQELARVDELLDEISARTRDIVDRVAISELRSALPALASQQPDTIRGLIEVTLEGDVENSKSLRLLEYLVTLLSVEERDMRRAVVCEPSDVAAPLRALAEERFAESDPTCVAAEQMFERAAAELLEAEDVGLVRDRIRRFKDELGSRILYPRVLAAAVAYNVAMWNRLADLIEGGRTLDRLAEELLAVEDEDAVGVASIFDSRAFASLVTAMRAHLCGEEPDDEACACAVAAFDVGGLAPDELEAFEASEEDYASSLVRSAVVLGLAVRHRGEIADALRQAGLDLSDLTPHWPRELAREMMATARKLLASGKYVEASRLLELKTRNLGIAVEAHAASPETASAARAREPETPGFSFSLPLLRQTLSMLAMGVALLLTAVLLWPQEPELRIYSKGDLASLSPYLRSGHRRNEDDVPRFVGTLNARWDGIGLAERRRVAGEIGQQLARNGVPTMVLVDAYHRIQARAEGGELVEVTPRRTTTRANEDR